MPRRSRSRRRSRRRRPSRRRSRSRRRSTVYCPMNGRKTFTDKYGKTYPVIKNGLPGGRKIFKTVRRDVDVYPFPIYNKYGKAGQRGRDPAYWLDGLVNIKPKTRTMILKLCNGRRDSCNRGRFKYNRPRGGVRYKRITKGCEYYTIPMKN